MSNTKVQQAEEAVTKARTALAERQKELAEAQKAKQRARALWDRGEGTSEGKLLADMEVERLERGVRADEQQLTFARRRVRALSPVLAEKVAHVLGDSVFGAKAKVATSRPITPTKDVEVTVVEVRTNEVADEHSGSVKGSVLVVATGPAFLRPFDAYEVARRLGANGVSFGHGFQRHDVREDAPGVFSCEFYIESALPLVPIIPRVQDHYVSYLLSKGQVDSLRQQTYSTVADADMLVGSASAKKVGEEIGSDGLRRVTVEAAMQCYPARAGVGTGEVGAAVTDYVTKHFAKGRGFHGVGVVVSVEIHGGIGSYLNHQGLTNTGAKVTAKVVLASKVPA